jgi:hypothetical protein
MVAINNQQLSHLKYRKEMKTKILFSAALAVAALTGCSDDQLAVNGEGRLMLSAAINTEIRESRTTTEDELGGQCNIWISKDDQGVVRKYEGISSIPADGITLTTGHYTAEAWAGDSVSASFEDRWFKGRQEFDIVADQATPVTVQCKIANVVAAVKYDSSINDVLKDYVLTVKNKRGSLVFEGEDARDGYFMMPQNDTDLEWELSGTLISNGSTFTKTGVIKNVQPTTRYTINVKHSDSDIEIGGAFFSIVIDESMIESEHTVMIVAAPVIKLISGDISEVCYYEQGKVGRKSFFITATAALSKVELKSDIFKDYIPALGGDDFDLRSKYLGDDVIATLKEGGVTYDYEYDSDEDQSWIRVNLNEELLNQLPDGSYSVSVTAEDANERSASAVFNFVVSNATVTTDAVNEAEVWSDEVTLSATVLNTNDTGYGFYYRESPYTRAANDWTFVAAEISNGKMVAKLTNLKPNTTYEYYAATDSYQSQEVISFTTYPQSQEQLQNASFENWNTSSTPYLVYASGDDMFWDTGNHGSSKAGINLTTPCSDAQYVHSGTYSAKLASQKATVFGIGKFAAGNMFIGKYLKTDGTDGVLGWGRPFTSKPKALKVWVRYEQGSVIEASSSAPLKVGDPDQGQIYIALLDGTTTTAEGENWPIVIRTKSSNRNLFDSQASNVLGYGEYVFTTSTAGDGLIQIEIPINYYEGKTAKIANIAVVASASRYGDYFTGGNSTMYLDDFELVY